MLPPQPTTTSMCEMCVSCRRPNACCKLPLATLCCRSYETLVHTCFKCLARSVHVDSVFLVVPADEVSLVMREVQCEVGGHAAKWCC